MTSITAKTFTVHYIGPNGTMKQVTIPLLPFTQSEEACIEWLDGSRHTIQYGQLAYTLPDSINTLHDVCMVEIKWANKRDGVIEHQILKNPLVIKPPKPEPKSKWEDPNIQGEVSVILTDAASLNRVMLELIIRHLPPNTAVVLDGDICPVTELAANAASLNDDITRLLAELDDRDFEFYGDNIITEF